MLGGGFIGQMHATNKQNRENLKKNKKKPFERQDYSPNSGEPLNDEKNLTESERYFLLQKIKNQNIRERIVQIISFIVPLALIILFIYFFLLT